MMGVKENLLHLKKELPPHVTLVAVSKTKTVEMMREAYDAGQRDFGENYVQELVEKQALLPADIRWHFIGHLQTNKVKYIASFVHLIHGVESLKLLREINKQAARNGRVIQVLLQLHIAMEETKFGLSFDECRDLLFGEEIRPLQNIKVAGLMAMASNTEDKDLVKREFLSVKDFYDSVKILRPSLTILSYGMSGDYELAIESGSNMVRIGSLIFGERQYT
jgi:pyridoxal phosphate enzyme (YggS family)